VLKRNNDCLKFDWKMKSGTILGIDVLLMMSVLRCDAQLTANLKSPDFDYRCRERNTK